MMIRLNRRGMGALAVVLAFIPDNARAQAVAGSFDQLQGILKAGQTVVVTDGNGRKTKGEVADVSASSLALRIQKGSITVGTRAFTEAAVRKIAFTDSKRNGALTGLAVGALPGALVGRFMTRYCENTAGSGCNNGPVVFAVLFGGLGAAIGAGIDGLINDRIVYDSSQRRSTVTFSPVIGTRQGVLVSVGF